MAASNDERVNLRHLARAAAEELSFENRYLAMEFIDWVVFGGEIPHPGLGPHDCGLLYGVLTDAIRTVFGESALHGDSEYLRRRDEAAPV